MSSSSEPWTAPENPSPNLKIALAYNDAMERWDEEALMNTFDETLEHRILPKSLMRPVLNKSLYRSYFQHLASMFKPNATKRTIHEVIESDDFVVMHISTKGESKTGHEYLNEYMILMHMMDSSAGDGSRKIRSVKEFVDSNSSSHFFPAERARVAEARSKQKYNSR